MSHIYKSEGVTRLNEADDLNLLVTLPKDPTCQEDFATSLNLLGDNLEAYPVILRPLN